MAEGQQNLPQLTHEQLVTLVGQLNNRLEAMEGGNLNPPPPARPIARPLKPERPSTYSGKKGESLDAWIFQLERYYEILRTPPMDQVPFAGTLLTDHAAMWWRMVYEQIEELDYDDQWEQFTTQLKAQFQPINTAESARTRLDKLRQVTSVLVYNTAFREVMLELPNMHMDDRIHAYIKGLKPQVASSVAMQRPATLLEAQRFADTADTIQFHHFPRRNFENPRPRQDNRGPAPMDVDSISRLTDAERERLRKIGGCFRCRKPGHLARDCPLTDRRHPRINAIDTPEPEESGKE
jgi:hypothetical protein